MSASLAFEMLTQITFYTIQAATNSTILNDRNTSNTSLSVSDSTPPSSESSQSQVNKYFMCLSNSSRRLDCIGNHVLNPQPLHSKPYKNQSSKILNGYRVIFVG